MTAIFGAFEHPMLFEPSAGTSVGLYIAGAWGLTLLGLLALRASMGVDAIRPGPSKSVGRGAQA